MKTTLRNAIMLLACLSSIGFAQASTDEVFTQLGWTRSEPNEQMVSTNKGKFNFYELTGFRIFMRETSAMAYDYIGKNDVDFELSQVRTTTSGSELSITFIHPYGDYKTRIGDFENILSTKLSKLNVTYIPRSDILGGTLISKKKSFLDSSFMLNVLKKISSEMK